MPTVLAGSVLEDKDPDDVKDYAINWSKVLVKEGETAIGSSVWSDPDPLGLVVLSAPPYAPYVSGSMCVVWVASGEAGTDYKLTNTIVTASSTPRTHEMTITIPCVER